MLPLLNVLFHIGIIHLQSSYLLTYLLINLLTSIILLHYYKFTTTFAL